ncbi:methyl-accepting chemotaxis protein [Sporosarcina luteola]|uniref:methyl-accepting chemotaxis protein n=1 Tax=Sporosarcina luteola TaxID=582850 RepID=UPI00203BF51A|nr:methyl-accepting chemotaxis protein [Sporosarcina luteola]MCM3636982.1 methyl-accepting chemotaxis protein [Sporosarcina luteola]
MRYSVRKKLWTGFLSLLLLMITAGALNYLTIPDISKEYTSFINDRMEKVILLEQLSTNQTELSNDLRGYLLYKETKYLKNRGELLESVDEKLMQLDSSLESEKSRALIEELKEASEQYKVYSEEALAAFNQGKDEEALVLAEKAEPHQSTFMINAERLVTYQREQMLKAEDKIEQKVKSTGIFIIGVLGLITILSIIISYLISNIITRPVGKMTDALKMLARGDFAEEPLLIKNRDEIGEMATAFNEMKADLRTIIMNTRDSSYQLAAQAEQLTASSEESLAASEMVAEIAEKNLLASDMQVHLVNDSASAMSEMANGITQITNDNAAMLASSVEVSRLVREGAGLMKDVTDQMSNISTSIRQSSEIITDLAVHSEKIRNVTGLITGIAEQTNLLALNAAIEAARAGEQGKGFAVVANEVRNLAEQSKTSAAEIGRMIDAIIQNVTLAVDSTEAGTDRVREGLGITEKTNEVFNEIELASNDVSSKVGTVSAAIEQIRTMSEQVMESSKKVQELAMQASTEAQSTSASTEEQLASNQEIASSAQTLSEVAEKLQNDMGRFTV